MTVTLVNLADLEARPISAKGVGCQAATFTDDWRPCRSNASHQKGDFLLCAPHTRPDEIEVVKPLTASGVSW